MAEVVIYSRPTCPFCNAAKEFLTKKGVVFKDVDVEKDKVQRDRIFRKIGEALVPIIEINGKTMIDFDKEELKKELVSSRK
jgi:glutaredoxin-like YruB-family protein